MLRKLLPVLLLAACAAPPAEDARDDRFLSGDKTDTGGLSDGTPQAFGVLAFVNAAGYDLLVDEVGLATSPAANIVNFRIGDDGLVGTYDDRSFASLAQLDDVPYVGPKVFAALLAYATDNGWVHAGADAGVWTYPDAAPWYPADAGVWTYPDAAPYADAWVWVPYPDAGW